MPHPTIPQFVTKLATTAVPAHVYNPYRGQQPFSQARRHNLSRYLTQMQAKRPSIILVAEAPGYRGCRLTGIPFVSPHLLRQGFPQLGLFGREHNYQPTSEWPQIQREASATIVWQSLSQAPQLPLLWNAFPFHPHQPHRPQTNRTPKQSELQVGQTFLSDLLTLFPINTVVAVGNKADSALNRWQIPHQKLRHPAHGGKVKFQHGLQAILAATDKPTHG